MRIELEDRPVLVEVVDTFIVRELLYGRYVYVNEDKSKIVARVMGSVRTRNVYAPEFAEDDLARLWFVYVRKKGMVVRR